MELKSALEGRLFHGLNDNPLAEESNTDPWVDFDWSWFNVPLNTL